MAKKPLPRYSDVLIVHDGAGFNAVEHCEGSAPLAMSANFPLFLIRKAWDRGCDFEAEADGFGPGAGTKGDWSAIRDSSPKAECAMLQKALNYLFPND